MYCCLLHIVIRLGKIQLILLQCKQPPSFIFARVLNQYRALIQNHKFGAIANVQCECSWCNYVLLIDIALNRFVENISLFPVSFLRRKVQKYLAASVCISRFCIYFQWIMSPGMSLYGHSGKNQWDCFIFFAGSLSFSDWLKKKYHTAASSRKEMAHDTLNYIVDRSIPIISTY